jgi:hypothetical protein
VELADSVASLGIRRSGDRAGVYHHDVRIRGFIRGDEPTLAQLALDSGAIGLRGPAAELLDVKGWHTAILVACGGHRTRSGIG